MPRNRNSKATLVDFVSGNSINDEYAPLRKAQDRLYTLDNPYVGSKRGILPDIADSLNRHGIKFNTMLDLFSGSGVVSVFFKLLGKQVISNDLLTSSYYNALAFVENESIVLTPEQIEFLCKNNNPNKTTWVRTNYPDRFTPEEAYFLDNYRANIDSLANKIYQEKISGLNQNLTIDEYSAYCEMQSRLPAIVEALSTILIEHYIMNRCFLGGRLNHGQILADVSHRIQHDRNNGKTMQFTLSSLPSFVDGAKKCKAYNGDAVEIAKKARIFHPQIEIAYIDPPYGQSQSDYATMYQFCEEYIYSRPLAELPHIQQAANKFAKTKNYQEHFREVLDNLQFIPVWAVSFNATSFEDKDKIVTILKDYKKNVIVVNIDHEYRYRKSRSKAVEYLFIAK